MREVQKKDDQRLRSVADPLWYKDASIYELHVQTFKDSNGDGIGDSPGLIQEIIRTTCSLLRLTSGRAMCDFGDGDEGHTAFHFPLMPRIYMALRRETACRSPIHRSNPIDSATCQCGGSARRSFAPGLDAQHDRSPKTLWRFRRWKHEVLRSDEPQNPSLRETVPG